MRLLAIITLFLLPFRGWGQADSVKATVIKTAEKTVVYKINGMRFVSFDCRCDTLKKGDVFMIPKARFDSLLLEARPLRKRDLEN
jgi:hypothetical protein